jgi:hypothetical protein
MMIMQMNRQSKQKHRKKEREKMKIEQAIAVESIIETK